MFTKHAIEPDFTCLQAKQPPHLAGYNHHQIELRLLENAPSVKKSIVFAALTIVVYAI